jgi:hypothetical protein
LIGAVQAVLPGNGGPNAFSILFSLHYLSTPALGVAFYTILIRAILFSSGNSAWHLDAKRSLAFGWHIDSGLVPVVSIIFHFSFFFPFSN